MMGGKYGFAVCVAVCVNPPRMLAKRQHHFWRVLLLKHVSLLHCGLEEGKKSPVSVVGALNHNAALSKSSIVHNSLTTPGAIAGGSRSLPPSFVRGRQQKLKWATWIATAVDRFSNFLLKAGVNLVNRLTTDFVTLGCTRGNPLGTRRSQFPLQAGVAGVSDLPTRIGIGSDFVSARQIAPKTPSRGIVCADTLDQPLFSGACDHLRRHRRAVW